MVQAVEERFADAQEKGHPEHADILIFASTEQEIRESASKPYIRNGTKSILKFYRYMRVWLWQNNKKSLILQVVDVALLLPLTSPKQHLRRTQYSLCD